MELQSWLADKVRSVPNSHEFVSADCCLPSLENQKLEGLVCYAPSAAGVEDGGHAAGGSTALSRAAITEKAGL
jgi:hypothetical protein